MNKVFVAALVILLQFSVMANANENGLPGECTEVNESSHFCVCKLYSAETHLYELFRYDISNGQKIETWIAGFNETECQKNLLVHPACKQNP
jgi:hypothetical protein